MISVIIPYDRDRGYLDGCEMSIMSQEGVDVEVIRAQGEQSVAKNFNNGLRRARGEFCKFVCEDDYLPDGALKILRNNIKDYPWIFANAYQEQEDRTWIYKPYEYSKEFMTLEENLRTNRIHGGTTLYRTEILMGIGGMDEDLWTGEEYDMHLKLWSMGYVPGYVDEEVYVHRIWSGQKSRKLRKLNKIKRDEEIKRIQSFYFDKVQHSSV